MEPRCHRVEVSGECLAITETGEGPPVVLVHGIPGSGATWQEVAARLAGSFRVFVPDLLGFGASSRPTAPAMLMADHQAAALAIALDLLGVVPAAVVGHDFGGPVALLLAAARPERVVQLGLFSTNAFADTPIPFPLSAVRWPAVGTVARRLLFARPAQRAMLRAGTGRGSSRLDPTRYLGDTGQSQAVATIFSSSLRDLAERYQPVEQSLRNLAVPALVGWGDRDPFFPVAQGERTAGACGARFRLYPGAGHFLPEERAPAVAEDLARLCDRATT